MVDVCRTEALQNNKSIQHVQVCELMISPENAVQSVNKHLALQKHLFTCVFSVPKVRDHEWKCFYFAFFFFALQMNFIHVSKSIFWKSSYSFEGVHILLNDLKIVQHLSYFLFIFIHNLCFKFLNFPDNCSLKYILNTRNSVCSLPFLYF